MLGREMSGANSPHCGTEGSGGVGEGCTWLMNHPPALGSDVIAVFVGRLSPTDHSK